MIAALGTLAVVLVTNLLGLAASIWMIRRGEPDNGRVPGTTPTWETLRGRLPLIGANLAVLAGSSAAAIWLAGDLFHFGRPGPVVWIAQVALVFLAEDAAFYAWHRALHENKALYRRIHRVHHQAWAPLPIEYIYVHPVEWMVGAVGPAAMVGLLIALQGGISVWVFWSYVTLRTLHELHIHSTRAAPPRWLPPLVGTPADHATHHAKPTQGRYASILRVWDRVLGTAR